MELNSIADTKISSNSPLYRAYRFWPIYVMAFARNFGYQIYGIALQNYLVYTEHWQDSLIGTIISIQTIIYMFGPLLGIFVTNHIGSKNTLLISSVGSVIMVALQLIFFNPWALVVLRSVDGIVIGFFWPNLQMEVSNWQRIGPKECCDQYFQRYGMSWNWGTLIGEFIGYFVAYLTNEWTVMILGWVMMIIMIPGALAMEGSQNKLVFDGIKGLTLRTPLASQSELPDEEKLPQSKVEPTECEPKTDSSNSTSTFLLAFPALFYLLGTMIYGFLKTFYPFIYPFFLKINNIPSYWVYLITAFYQIAQMIIISKWSVKDVGSGFRWWAWSMVFNIAFALSLTLSQNLWLLTAAFILNGAFSGYLYSFTSKIMLQYGNTYKTMKYATYYEFVNGIGFGFSPLIVGFIADVNINLNFPVLTIILCAFTAVLWMLSKNAREVKKKSNEH